MTIDLYVPPIAVQPQRRRRHAPGGVVTGKTRRGTSYAIRFRALGKRRFQLVGYEADGVTLVDAQAALARVLDEVRRGVWQPPEPEPIRLNLTLTLDVRRES